MKKINIKDGQPKVGEKILAYGYRNSELGSRSDTKDWYFVAFESQEISDIIGICYYSAWVENIEYWIELNLD